MDIKDRKVIIITGAGGRIGSIFVENALKENCLYPVLFTSKPDNFLHIKPDRGLVVKVDLKSADSIKEAMGSVYSKLGKADILINNAATMQQGMRDFISDSADSKINEVFEINTVAPIYCIKYFLNAGGDEKLIINLLAERAYTGHRYHIDYYASKAALLNATRSFSEGYPRHRFRALMLRKIASNKNDGDSPDSIWHSILKDIKGMDRSRYREVRYYSTLNISMFKSANVRYDKVKRITRPFLNRLFAKIEQSRKKVFTSDH